MVIVFTGLQVQFRNQFVNIDFNNGPSQLTNNVIRLWTLTLCEVVD
jgi:hypothetical protein